MKERNLKLAILTAILCIFLVLSASRALCAAQIREVRSSQKNLILAKTAIGFSTIIEFQTKPQSAVLGDQDAFKLEYVGSSITIKPVVANAKTNLFVYTEFERFNFSIITGPAQNVDYIVRVLPSNESIPLQEKKAQTSPDPFRVINVNRKSTYDGITIKVTKLKLASDQKSQREASLIEFELSSTKRTYPFQAASIGIKQGDKFLEVESVFLEKTELSAGGTPVGGVIAILNQEWKRTAPLRIVFAIQMSAKKSHRLEVFIPTSLNSLQKKESSNGKDLFPKNAQ